MQQGAYQKGDSWGQQRERTAQDDLGKKLSLELAEASDRPMWKGKMSSSARHDPTHLAFCKINPCPASIKKKHGYDGDEVPYRFTGPIL